jgi:hypothetical protein
MQRGIRCRDETPIVIAGCLVCNEHAEAGRRLSEHCINAF